MSIPSLKIVFAGTPEFASIALEAITLSQHEVIAVYTQPDRQAGRGLKVVKSPVKQVAIEKQIDIYQPKTLKDAKEHDKLRALNPDVMVVAAYGLILPKEVLSIPKYGCINIHGSLLPRWRGAAPIQRAIMAGDKSSGITIMQMDEGLDTGDMLLKHEYMLDADETAQTLHDRLAKMGAESIVEALNLLAEEKLVAEKQDDALATYAHKLTKDEGLIDWSQPARQIESKVRAFNPWPVAFVNWQGKPLRIWQATVVENESNAAPGTLVHASRDGIDIATEQGVLRLLKVQLPGGKPISVTDFYNSQQQKLVVGEVF